MFPSFKSCEMEKTTEIIGIYAEPMDTDSSTLNAWGSGGVME